MEEKTGAYSFWWGNLKQRNHLEVTGIDGRMILKQILKEEDGRAWSGLIWRKVGKVSGSC